MKCKFIFARLLAVALCVMVSCTKKEVLPENQEITGKLHVEIGINVVEHSTANLLKATSVEDFKVIIYNQSDCEVQSYEHASEMPTEISLSPGTYYVVAHSNNAVEAAFEEPFYLGRSEEVSLDYEESKIVHVTCELMNVKVTVAYSIHMVDEFCDYTTTVSHDNGSLVFTGDETRAGYFSVSPLSIEVNLYYFRPDSTVGMKTLNGTIPDPLPQKHYEIRIDARLNEGEALIHIDVNDSTDMEIVDIHDTDTTDPVDRYINPGDLIITEIMYNPDALADNAGEYLEIYNTTDHDLDLDGVMIQRGSTNSHTIDESILIPSNDQVVLANSSEACDFPDHVYGNTITLTNSGAVLYIIYDQTDIFSLDYGSFPSASAGHSIQLDPGYYNNVDAANGLYWCASSSAFSTGDFGTPGMPNDQCD